MRPRIRTVKPELFQHEALYDAERAAKLPLRIAYVGLWTVADREGRFEWRPRMLKANILPFDDVDFEGVLLALTAAGFIERYQVNGQEFALIPAFLKHQCPNHREKPSELPDPARARTGTHGHARARIVGTGTGTGTGTEGNGTTKSKAKPAAPMALGQLPKKPSWVLQLAEIWVRVYQPADGKAPIPKIGKLLLPVKDAPDLAARFTAYVTETPARYVNLAKFVETFGSWGNGKASPQTYSYEPGIKGPAL